MLTETQILAIGVQKLMEKQANINTVLLKFAEVVDAVVAKVDAAASDPELPETSTDAISAVDKSIIASLQEDLKKSKIAEDSPTDPDVQPAEVVSEADPKIAGSLDDIIAKIIEGDEKPE